MRIIYKRPARRYRLPVTAVKTYQVSTPQSTHWRSATCTEIDCQNYLNGWRVRIEGLTDAQKHAVTHSGRKFTVMRLAADQGWYVFEAGQPCFRSHEHKLPTGRPSLYVVRDGDPWRGNPRGTSPRVHTRPEFWVEDFAEHQQRLHERWKRG
jgi:hypothetical protein